METKICKSCNIEKKVNCFGVVNKSKDGLNSLCKECRNIIAKKYRNNNQKIKEIRKKCYIKNKKNVSDKMKEYYLKNSDKVKKRVLNYKEENPNKVKEINKNYYIKNYEKIKEYNKTYYNNNFENIRQQKSDYKKQNREKFNDLYKEKYKNDPFFKLIEIVRGRVKNFLKSKNINKNNKTFEIVGCSPEFLKEHIEKQFTEGMSWELMGEHIHIDHIIPLSSAKTEEEIYKLCHYTNLQPLWAKDNLKKSNKII
jgi:hypothetical protein